MFKRDATPALKSPRELLALSEAEIRALSDAEINELIEHFQRDAVVRKKELHRGCIDRRCRRIGSCIAGNRRCLCTDVPPIGKRERKRERRASQVRPAVA